MKKNKTFKAPKKFDCVMSADMLPHKMTMVELINSCASLQNCDRVVFINPPYAEACHGALVQKIGRACVAV